MLPVSHAGISLVSGPGLPFTAQDVQSGYTLLLALSGHQVKACPVCDEQMSCEVLKLEPDQWVREAFCSEKENRVPLTAMSLKSQCSSLQSGLQPGCEALPINTCLPSLLRTPSQSPRQSCSLPCAPLDLGLISYPIQPFELEPS